VHAARKWLVGEAIPTQEKLRALASWLDVPADWLRFGGDQPAGTGNAKGGASASERFASEDIKLISDLQRLDEHYRAIAREIIRLLVRINREK
jgi:transcriptional regulator with XRE-family HTH domain